MISETTKEEPKPLITKIISVHKHAKFTAYTAMVVLLQRSPDSEASL